MAEQKDSPRIVIIGAGATGRGQIGRLAYQAGFALTFIERRKDLVDVLHSTGKYTVGLAGRTIEEVEIDGFEVIHTDELFRCMPAVARADIIATAVLPTNLEAVAPLLAKGLGLRRQQDIDRPLNVIACENMERSSRTLRDMVLRHTPKFDWGWVDARVGFPDAMVACLVPWPKDPLYLMAEAIQEWSVDARGVKPPIPELPGMTLSANQEAALERKLFIKNTGHFATGILGHLKGFQLMHEAARDPEIFALADAATQESAAAVVGKHGFDPHETEEYRRTFMEQMRSSFLPDEVGRVIRELGRKLGREERLVGPALVCLEQGREPRALAEVIARAFQVKNPEDPQTLGLRADLAALGLAQTIAAVCGIPASHPLSKLILAMSDASLGI
jgi:mannitol-1-phosphate 5-dehydrogenase